MGWVHIERLFSSPPEERLRTVRIYTPDAYDAEPGRRFPVAYFQDGQNVFAHPDSARLDTWRANEIIEETARDGRTEPWILVAVDHSEHRWQEYAPFDEPRLNVDAGGTRYLSFLADHLKPYIDRTYRTRPGPQDTALFGSSLGGLLALAGGFLRPDVFGRVGALSPALMWGGGRLTDLWTAHTGLWTRLYLDVGTLEKGRRELGGRDYVTWVRSFHDALVTTGYQPWELRLVVDEGGLHDEQAWARRLPEAFAWVLGSW